MGMPATTDRYWTPADLAQFPEGDGCRYECIDGELLVTPAPRFDRGHASQCLPLAISAALGAPKRVFYGLLDLRSEPMAVVEPDLVVFRDPMSRRARLDDMAGVSVLVEVLSPSTTKRDQARPGDQAPVISTGRRGRVLDRRPRQPRGGTLASGRCGPRGAARHARVG